MSGLRDLWLSEYKAQNISKMYKVLWFLVAVSIFKNTFGFDEKAETCFQEKFCIPANYNKFDRPEKGTRTYKCRLI